MEEPLPPAKDEPQKSSRKLTKILLHIFLHVFLLSYFLWCTVVYIRYDPDSRNCKPPFKVGKPPLPTELLHKEHEWRPHILCNMNWCLGYGFLLLLFLLFYIVWIYYWIFKPKVGQKFYDKKVEPLVDSWMTFSRQYFASLAMICIIIILVSAYVIFECWDGNRKLVGVIAPILFILLGFGVSTNRLAIPWRVVIHGLLAQLLLAIMCLRFSLGRDIFNCIGEKVVRFLHFTDHGARFVFGDRICDDFVFAFAILSVIFFVSVVTSILFYLGILQRILMVFGWFLEKTVGTTACESVTAVANIFLGMAESVLMIRPYIELLTPSELHCICVSGYATVAGTVLGAYMAFGASPAYLITASVMAAPGSLAMAKLFYPEDQESRTTSDNMQLAETRDVSFLDAAVRGAASALAIIVGIVANIIAFLAIIFFLNAVCEWFFELGGMDGVTFVYMLTQFFKPIVFLMGVPTHDCENVALVVAEKTLINEFVAYRTLGEMITDRKVDERSAGIATFALCGFANPGSVAILIAALTALAPNRRADIVRVALRALLAGSIVSFMSASIAGIIIEDSYKTNRYVFLDTSKSIFRGWN